MDEVSDPAMSVLAEGHQWYWSYQYPDFLNADDEFIEFDSYLVPESDLEDGALRLLEVDNRVILPELTHVRFIVTAADVIHSFACPALGIKCDAYPGRLNQVSVLINREGTFYGQCSEICGILTQFYAYSNRISKYWKVFILIRRTITRSEKRLQFNRLTPAYNSIKGFFSIMDTVRYYETIGIKLDRKYININIVKGGVYKGFTFEYKN
jgi:hypothetical protein